MDLHRLAILTTHPIQYQAPWFCALHQHPEIELQVFFCHNATAKEQSAAGFGVEFEWDMPLLEGYSHRFLKNVASYPTIETFKGLDTPEIKEIIAREHFDAVLISGWNYKSAWQAMRACWKTGTPVMTRGDSHLHTQRHPLKAALKYPFYRWFIPKFDACLVVGKWSADYYRHYGAHSGNIFFVPHVVDEAFFLHEAERLQPQRAQLRREWGLREDPVVFVFAGKFTEVKRPLDFIHGVTKAARQKSSIMGLMVGDGELREQCEQLVHEMSAPIRFTGFLNQSEMVRAFAASDSLVLPSGGETWGLVVNEAMLCGCSCIVSDQVGCSPDLIIPGQTGAIFPMGNVDALSEMLVQTAADRKQLEEMGQKSKQRILRHYSMDAAVRGVLDAMASNKESRIYK
jgi:glycosyltransferase involved in cell wall biosynthesis